LLRRKIKFDNVKTAIRYTAFGLLCLLSVVTAGCGAKDNPRTRLDFWAIGSEAEKIGELFADFRQQNPDIDLRVQQIPWSAAHEKLLTAFAGDATPDVCQLGNTWIPEFGTLGALESLNAFIERSPSINSRDYFPGLWKTNQLDASVYGLPWYADTRLLFYRKDMLAAAGWKAPPSTWDQWLTAMRDVKRKVNPNGYAILMPTNEWEHLTILALQTDSQMLRDDDRFANFNSPQFRQALEFYKRLFDEELAPAVSNTQISNYWEEFGRGYFAMYITGPWNIGEFRRRLPAAVQNEWATAPLPRPEGAKVSISQAGGSGLAIFRRSKHKDEAWRLIEFLSRPEQMVRFYKLTGNLPPRESAWKLGRLEDDPPVGAFHEQLKHVVPLPRVPEWEQITTYIIRAGQAVVAQKKTVNEAVTDLDRQVDELLDKRRWLLAQRQATKN
jgi:multiple sugar transport system substrate-binding protein